MHSLVACYPGWMGPMSPSCHQTRGNPSTSLRLVMALNGLDSIANSRSAHDSPQSLPKQSDTKMKVKINMSVSPSPDCRTISGSPRSLPIVIQLRTIFTCSYRALTAQPVKPPYFHWPPIRPAPRCLNRRQAARLSPTLRGPISKEQAPFQTDCPLSCSRRMARHGSDLH